MRSIFLLGLVLSAAVPVAAAEGDCEGLSVRGVGCLPIEDPTDRCRAGSLCDPIQFALECLSGVSDCPSAADCLDDGAACATELICDALNSEDHFCTPTLPPLFCTDLVGAEDPYVGTGGERTCTPIIRKSDVERLLDTLP